MLALNISNMYFLFEFYFALILSRYCMLKVGPNYPICTIGTVSMAHEEKVVREAIRLVYESK